MNSKCLNEETNCPVCKKKVIPCGKLGEYKVGGENFPETSSSNTTEKIFHGRTICGGGGWRKSFSFQRMH